MIARCSRLGGVLTALALAWVVPAQAGDLVYQPIVPAFGGSPLYEDYLVGTAQIQNKHLPQGGGGGGGDGGIGDISFPDISIDLGGGLGGGSAPPVVVIPLPAAGTTP